jgi:hypothetical protein
MPSPIAAVVDLVAGVEPSLEIAVVTELVATVAGGRTKSRRLLEALNERPQLLVTGTSPAPRVVGELLIALRRAADLRSTLRSVPPRAGHDASPRPGLALRHLRGPTTAGLRRV